MKPDNIKQMVEELLEKPSYLLYLSEVGYEHADLVLVPMKKTIYVRGRGKFRKWVDKEFKGAERVSRAVAYCEGIASALARVNNLASHNNTAFDTFVAVRDD